MHRWFHRGGADRILVLEFALLALAMFPLSVNAADVIDAHSATTQPSHFRAPSTAPVPPPTLNRTLAAIVHRAVADRNYNVTAIQGGAFAQIPYSDISSDGVLIGFRIGLAKFFNNDVIKSIQPIYLTDRGEQFGQRLGVSGSGYNMVDIKAPHGYAVGAIKIRGGGGLDAITVTVMRIGSIGLDPNDTQTSPRIGGPGGGEISFTGNGSPAIGITGRIDAKGDWLGLGLIFLNPPAQPIIPEVPLLPQPAQPAPAQPAPPLAPGLKAVDATSAAGTVEA